MFIEQTVEWKTWTHARQLYVGDAQKQNQLEQKLIVICKETV